MSINIFCEYNFRWEICARFLRPLYPHLSFSRFIICMIFVIIAFRLFSSLLSDFSSIFFYVLLLFLDLFLPFFCSFLCFFLSSLLFFVSPFSFCFLLLYPKNVYFFRACFLQSLTRMWFTTWLWFCMKTSMVCSLRFKSSSPAVRSTSSQWSLATTAMRRFGWASSELRIWY